MTVKEFYESINENFDDVLGRLKLESRVLKYVTKFPADECFRTLQASMDKKNYQDAFRAAHTLKGICLNLGFNNFYTVISDITEKLRHYEDTAAIEADGSVGELIESAARDYDRMIAAIGQIEQ